MERKRSNNNKIAIQFNRLNKGYILCTILASLKQRQTRRKESSGKKMTRSSPLLSPKDYRGMTRNMSTPMNISIQNISAHNPNLETTNRARFHLKHVDVHARIVQKTTNKVSQTVCCWWHVRRWGWVGPNIGESFGKVSYGKVSIIAIIILLYLLHEKIWFDRYVENKSPTHRSKRGCLGSATPSCTYGTCGMCGYYYACHNLKGGSISMIIAYRRRGGW